MRPVAIVAVVLSLAVASTADAAPATPIDRCVSAIAGDILRYADKAGKCIRKCEDAKRRGDLPESTRCKRPSNNPQTQTCLLAALEGLSGSKSNALRRCTDDHIETLYSGTNTCPGKNDDLPSLLQCLARRSEKTVQTVAKRVYQAKRPPVCGDGQITGGEECDPNASASTCNSYPYTVCHPTYCSCTFVGCGNGLIDGGEDCDYNAYPNGCSFFEYCNYGCTCSGTSSPSQAFLAEPKGLID